jgi:RNA polymerase sigma factor (sigma-70 family)
MAILHGAVLDDSQILAQVRNGDTAAFGLLWRRYEPDARAVARYLTRSSHEVDDVVAEAFAKVLRAIQGGAGPTESFRLYLLTAVRRTSWRRNEQRAAVTLDDDEATWLTPMAVEDIGGEANGFEGAIAEAFRSLAPRWQTVLWHTEIVGRSSAEVGELLGLSPNAAAALIGRARAGLRHAYEEVTAPPPLPAVA